MKFVFLFVISLLILGCGSTLQPPTSTLSNVSSTRTFTLYNFDGTGSPVQNSHIVDSIKNELIKTTSAPKFERFMKGGDGIFRVRGFTVEFKPDINQFWIYYLNGKEYQYSKQDLVSKVIGKMQLSTVSRSFEETVYSLSVLETLTVQRSSDNNVETDLLLTPEEVSIDLTQMVEHISIGIELIATVSDHIVTEYSPNAVFANFQHVRQGIFTPIDNRQRVGIFRLDSSFPDIKIQVIPFRTGSKVLFTYDYKYKLTGNGHSTHSKDTKSYYKQVIDNIANL